MFKIFINQGTLKYINNFLINLAKIVNKLFFKTKIHNYFKLELTGMNAHWEKIRVKE